MYPCISKLSINPHSSTKEERLEISRRSAKIQANSQEFRIKPTLHYLFGDLSRYAGVGNMWHVSLKKTSDSTTASSQLIQLDYHEAIKQHIIRQKFQSSLKEANTHPRESGSKRTREEGSDTEKLPAVIKRINELTGLTTISSEEFDKRKERQFNAEDGKLYVMLLSVSNRWKYGQLSEMTMGEVKMKSTWGEYRFTEKAGNMQEISHPNIMKYLGKNELYLWEGNDLLTEANIDPLLDKIGEVLVQPNLSELLDDTNGMNLEMEYQMHCNWISAMYAPSLENEAELSASFKRVMVSIDERDKAFPRDPRKMEFNDLRQQIKQSMQDAEELRKNDPDALTFPQIDNAVRDVRFKKYIKGLMKSLRCNTLYGNTQTKEEDKTEEEDKNKEEDKKIQWEHVTPLSWLNLTSLLYQFQYAHHDPVMLGLATATENGSRGNKPLGFTRNPGDNSWSLPINAQRPALARIIVYSSLTYPLLCQNGHPPVITSSSPQPTGVPSYAKQMSQKTKDGILRELIKDPEEWELDVALLYYLHFKVVNPFVFSKKWRDAVANPKENIHKLLMRRIEGTDLTSRTLLMELVQLVNFKT